ncbi:hypothetical protein LTR91_026475 [Friedmanniomyces endolithicus]|uniref:AMP-binding enzyme C-terminal domain-containing protein n=1 Tax=Friedmanniomyces endolithicus TaxID=329885 RepID=A0AAN6GY61_9PEZI|nr:hypothetical protein LTR57_008666 [Friedmanniomyces endolithicus]KAK0949421.1 hypothetical protein LTR91_026475 [Friedmanniomyces endolithicus]KAK0950844.1 hypothetical protein LTS01_025466 [Friedmanniomyces endolithicus]KAK1034426.1 hypothetical protein LTS16_015505 [Friedmanniomyces endolithicus]
MASRAWDMLAGCVLGLVGRSVGTGLDGAIGHGGVMLFLLMKPGKPFTQDLVKRAKDAIARDVGRRCVPKYVFETPEIPTTINLKKVELPVKQIVSGKTIKPSDTLANKACLDFYYQFSEVENLVQPRSKL